MSYLPDLRAESSQRDDARLLRFLNALYPLDEPIAWLACLRDALGDLLVDVDRISISINLESFDAEHGILYGHTGGTRVTPIVVQRTGPDAPATRLISEAAENGFPVDDYHPGTVFTFSSGESAYLGAIILWRLAKNPPLDEHTLETMHELRPFLTYRFSECVARMVREERVERSIGMVAAAAAMRAGLSGQQQEIFALSATGMSIGSISRRLGVPARTVRRALQAIYRMTGAYDVGGVIRRFVGLPEE